MDSFLQALLGMWRTNSSWQPKGSRVFCEDEVYKSLDMASKALQQKNKIIASLQKRLEESEERNLAARGTQNIAMSSSTADDCSYNCPAKLDAPLDVELTEDYHMDKEAEVSNLKFQLLDLKRAVEEKDATIEELAQLIASREASQVALVETVQAFIDHQLPSMPATPRDQMGASQEDDRQESDGDAAARRFEAMVSFWQERLRAQAQLSTLKLRAVDGDTAVNTGGDGDDDTPEMDGSASGATTDSENSEEEEDAALEGTYTPPEGIEGMELSSLSAEASGDIAPITPL